MQQLDERQFQELTGGGECHLHHHPVDKSVDHVQIDQIQAAAVIMNVSTDYTAKSRDDIVIVDSTLASVNVTLPLAKNGKEYTLVKKVAANNMVILFTGGELVFGDASITISSKGVPVRLKAITGGYITI